jgi:hypothetical protein
MELTELTAIPVIVALVQLFKPLNISEKFYPFISLALGIVIAFLIPEPWDVKASIVKGILFGLSASGLYSGVKKVVE